MDPTEYLLPEIVEKIFSYLPAKDLSSVSTCCVKWREITNTDPFWLGASNLIDAYSNELPHEKTNVLHMRKQRCRSAAQ